MNLGTALSSLGKQESGTEKLEEAVAVGEKQSFDPVDVLDPFHDQHLALTAKPASVFIFRRRQPDHRADARFAALVGEQRTNQSLAVDPVGLRPPPPA